MIYNVAKPLISSFLVFYLTLFAVMPTSAKEQNPQSKQKPVPKTESYEKGNPRDRGTPNRRVGGGTRSENCQAKDAVNQKLTAIIPVSEIAIGTIATPALLFYVPYSTVNQNQLLQARFSLQDIDGYSVIQPIEFPLTVKPGIVSVQLKQILEPGKIYQMSFTVICDQTDSPNQEVVSGQLQRISSTKITANSQTTNLWLNVFAEIAQTQCTQINRTDLSRWSEQFKQLNLSSLSSEKVVQCVSQP